MRVLDFTRVLAGPWASQILGDQGFDVVKIESLEGDETRAFLPHRDGESVYFACANRNKRSVALDLRRAEAREVVLRLAATSDVVLENFRPGVLDRLGLGYAVLREANPRLVYVSISAFGPPGEAVSEAWSRRAGYDLVLQAMGGITELTGSPPAKAGPSIADLASAMTAVQAVLFALLEEPRGRRIDVSMLDVQHHLLAYYASAWLNAGRSPPPPSNAHPSIAPYNLYRCADGWLAIACANDALWQKLRVALGWEDDAGLATVGQRVAARAELDRRITEALGTRSVTEWDALLAAAGVPCGPSLDVAATLALPVARQLEVGGWRFPAPPIPMRASRAPPRLGEHTWEVLGELGYDQGAVRALIEAGVARGSGASDTADVP